MYTLRRQNTSFCAIFGGSAQGGRHAVEHSAERVRVAAAGDVKSLQICEKDVTNLIFSAFADRAAKAGVQFTVQAGISQALPVSESDLCVLLSNALENALHAAVRCREAGQGAFIETIGHEKGKKLFLQITNSCLPDVQFREGVPVTDRTGHGLGVRSICAISERYGGLTSFAAKDGQLTLRVML